MIVTGLLAPIHAGHAAQDRLDDRAWIAGFNTVEAALAQAQANVGIIPHTAARDIIAVAHTIELDSEYLGRAARGGANPIVAYVGKLVDGVAARSTDSARFVHFGATSQDILDTTAMMLARSSLLSLLDDVDAMVETLSDLTERHASTPTVARTLGVHAVPTTFGAKTAVWLSGIAQARDRIGHLVDELPIQLGGAGGTQASYLEVATSARIGDPERAVEDCAACFADILSLQVSEPWHTLRIPVVDIATVCTLLSGVLGKIATDVITASRTEIRELSEPSGDGRGESSAMPHKQNPARSALIRSAAMQIPALCLVLHQAMISEDERSAGAWHSEWEPLRQILLLTEGAASTTRAILGELTVHTERMRTNLAMSNGQVCSERLSLRLAHYVGAGRAKAILQEASFASESTGTPLLAELQEHPEIIRDAPYLVAELEYLLTPDNYLGNASINALRALRRRRVLVSGLNGCATT